MNIEERGVKMAIILILLALCIFWLGYNCAMIKVCICMKDLFEFSNVSDKNPIFIEGMIFVSNKLKDIT